MPIAVIGNSGAVAEVDGTTFRAVRAIERPVDYASLGCYHCAMTSLTINAGLVAANHVFAFRWGDWLGRLALVTHLSLSFQTLTPFTAGTLTDFGFDAFVVRGYTGSHSGGLAALLGSMGLTTHYLKSRTPMGDSLLADMRIMGNGALTPGTQTFDGQPFVQSVGDSQRVNPAAATEEQSVFSPSFIWQPNVGNGESPLIFARDEGIVIRNRAAWPAAGTGIITVRIRWSEVEKY